MNMEKDRIFVSGEFIADTQTAARRKKDPPAMLDSIWLSFHAASGSELSLC